MDRGSVMPPGTTRHQTRSDPSIARSSHRGPGVRPHRQPPPPVMRRAPRAGGSAARPEPTTASPAKVRTSAVAIPGGCKSAQHRLRTRPRLTFPARRGEDRVTVQITDLARRPREGLRHAPPQDLRPSRGKGRALPPAPPCPPSRPLHSTMRHPRNNENAWGKRRVSWRILRGISPANRQSVAPWCTVLRPLSAEKCSVSGMA